MFTITDEHDLSGLCIKSIHTQRQLFGTQGSDVT